jgi:UDP-glucose 4-epimerase
VSAYLVTGGAGFIGSHVVEALVGRGARVRVLDDLSTGREENLAAVADQVELVVGDVVDPEVASAAVAGCEYVIHLAAIASVQASLETPRRTHRVNVDGTLTVLEAARRAEVQRVIFASSAAIYGDHTALPLSECLPPISLSPYAASKAAGESYCRAFWASYDLPTVTLRFFNVYGPRQDPNSPYSGVISVFADRMSCGGRPIIYGDGEQTRDFVYVKDVVRSVLAACERDAAVGGVFNIANGQQTSVLELVEVLNRILGSELQPQFAPPRAGEVRYSQADVRRAREALGIDAQVPLEEGLRDLVQVEYR